MSASFPDQIDKIIRFLLYVLIFWIPYSSAAIEICVISALILWIIKHGWIFARVDKNISFPRRLLRALLPEASPLNGWIYLFLLICMLSVAGSAFWEQAFRGFLTKTAEWFVIYFLVIEVFKEKRHLQLALGIFLFTAFSTALDGIFQFYVTQKDIFSGHVIIDGRATASFDHSNKLAGFLTFPLFLSLSLLFLRKSPGWLKKISPWLFLCLLWTLVITFSRGGWVSGGFGFLLFLLIYIFHVSARRSRRWVAMILAFLVIGGVVSTRIPPLWTAGDRNMQLTTNWRWSLWVDTVKMIRDKPFLGHGLNTYMMLFQEYRRGKPLEGKRGRDLDPTYAHNSFLQLAAETGIVGLLAFLALLARAYQHVLLTMRSLTRGDDFFILLLGLLCGLSAFLFHSCLDTHFYTLQLSALGWVMVGLLISMDKVLRKSGKCGIRVGL